MATTYSLETDVARSPIGNLNTSWLRFRKFAHPYSADISKCYSRVLLDDEDAFLRLSWWLEDINDPNSWTIYKRPAMDFGDPISPIIIRLIQTRILPEKATFQVTKDCLKDGSYADNYEWSVRTRETYEQLVWDMEKIHEEIGLPLKAHFTAVATDPNILPRK